MRVQEWHLAGHAKYYRQNILLSSFASPDLNALFNKYCHSHAGKSKLQSSFPVRQSGSFVAPFAAVCEPRGNGIESIIGEPNSQCATGVMPSADADVPRLSRVSVKSFCALLLSYLWTPLPIMITTAEDDAAFCIGCPE